MNLQSKQIKISLRVGLVLLFSMLATMLPHNSFAQITTATLRGQVADLAGAPRSGVKVSLIHTESQALRTGTTNNKGAFVFTGLKVGGPYKITASAQGKSVELDQIMLKADNNETIELVLDIKPQAEKIEITGKKVVQQNTTKLFNAADIAKKPSFNNDPKDIARQSPDAYTNGNELSIGGANVRSNSITVDGTRQNDDFGLNRGGYPTGRSPISMNAVQELSVNKAPFDVRYGKFTGGNISIVTKSGTNDYKGSVSVRHTNERWASGQSQNIRSRSPFKETTYSFSLGGPILKDKLHFFLSYERLNMTSPNTSGVAGSGAAKESKNIKGEDVERIQQISDDVYGFDAGSVGKDGSEFDEKLLAKINWEINEDHRFELAYQTTRSVMLNSGRNNESSLSLTSNWYNKKESLNTISAKLISDWTLDLSSKIELSKKKVIADSVPLNGRDFMEATINTNKSSVKDPPPPKYNVVIGPDINRHENYLETDTSRFYSELNYLLDDHLLTGGLEYERTKIFNLYVPSSKGEAKYNSVEDFEAKKPDSVKYNNSITHNAKDAAANWGYNTTTLFMQDEYQINSSLTTRFGLRLERFGSIGKINHNQKFEDRHGFSNTSDLEGKQALLPRLGATYKFNKALNFSGGAGLYSGGAPNVWVSNAYTNDGISVNSLTGKGADVAGFDGRNIPQNMKEKLAAGDGNVDALDPDFKIPQTWKFNLGTNYKFDITDAIDNVRLSADYTYSRVRYGVIWKDLRRNHEAFTNNLPTHEGPDGRDIYQDFKRSGYDLLLTNTNKGYSHVANIGLDKAFAGGFNIGTSYSWQKVMDVNSGVASTSRSNVVENAVGKDPNDLELSTSNFERKHRFVVTTGYENNFFGELKSGISFFVERRSGQPYSYTFGRDSKASFGEPTSLYQSGASSHYLFYVPKGDGSDVVLKGIDAATFDDYLDETGLDEYRGKIAPRNAFASKWVDSIDMRLSQELPGFKDTHSSNLIFDIVNVPNLLNRNWGQEAQADYPYFVNVVDVEYDYKTGKYVYSNFKPGQENVPNFARSIWKMQVTASYMF